MGPKTLKGFVALSFKEFDIAVVGGGHAGIEAAFLSSQFGLKVLLLT